MTEDEAQRHADRLNREAEKAYPRSPGWHPVQVDDGWLVMDRDEKWAYGEPDRLREFVTTKAENPQPKPGVEATRPKPV